MKGGTPSSATSRELVVLFADVEGYSRLMARDEAATFRALQRAVAEARAGMTARGGWMAEAWADSFLAAFGDAAQAVAFARDFQRRDRCPAEPGGPSLAFRIGIDEGRVEIHDGRLRGDPVHVAGRLQEHAPAGGACVSDRVRRSLGAAAASDLVPLGQLGVSLAGEPVVGHRLALGGIDGPSGACRLGRTGGTTPGSPTVAVLGFDGDVPASTRLATELAGHLSRFREFAVLPVLDRPAAWVQGDAGRRAADFAVSGTALERDGRVRLRLVVNETRSGRVVWMDRHDAPEALDAAEVGRGTAACFERLAARLVPPLRRALGASALGAPAPERRPAEALVARGFSLCATHRRPAVELAAGLFREALRAEPGAPAALAGLGRAAVLEWLFGWAACPERSLDRALRLAGAAVERDPMDARCWAELGHARLYAREHDSALAALGRAVELNPADPDVLVLCADAVHSDGRTAEALPIVRRALELNPYCPDRYLWMLAVLQEADGRHEETVATVRRMRDPGQGRRLLARSYAHHGLLEEARAQSRRVLGREPGFSVRRWVSKLPERDPAVRERCAEGLRRAGLPA